MNIEVICVIVTTLGVALSSLISLVISRQTANKEIEKMLLLWKHEDVVSSDEEFASMVKAVSIYINNNAYRNQSEAIGLVGAVRSKEHGKLGHKLDELYILIKDDKDDKIAVALSEVIEEKRISKGYALHTHE